MARWIGYTAISPASPDDITAGPQFKALHQGGWLATMEIGPE
jgi:hypothetical protein